MRKNIFYFLCFLCGFFWLGTVYFLSVSKSNLPSNEPRNESAQNKLLLERLQRVEQQVVEQVEENSQLLQQLKRVQNREQSLAGLVRILQQNTGRSHPLPPAADTKQSQDEGGGDQQAQGAAGEEQEEEEEEAAFSNEEIALGEGDVADRARPVIPVLLFACNRVTVNKALDLLLAYRPDKEQFPIVVSQDCGHQETAEVIKTYGDQIVSIQQPDLSEPQVPAKEAKFKGYFKIARHYGWALNQVFKVFNHDQVIIVEDDLEVAPDFFEYFGATLTLLKSDSSLWCVSAWNDNGKEGLIEESAPERLYRSDFFPGLGWMITKEVWAELGPKWPRSYWDDWMREAAQRRGRACIRPEVSRTKTFGKVGVSNGLFFDKHLKFIVLSKKFVPFTVMDLTYLTKDNYDNSFVKDVYKTQVLSLEEIQSGKKADVKVVRLTYHTKENFKKYSRALGIMDDFKSGVPRTAYRGIVSLMYKGRRVFLAPNLGWKGYDPSW